MPVSTDDIKTIIESASAMALASSGSRGINVVPLSMVRVHEGKIQLFNFFMDKTIENLKENPEVAFSCWSGLEGIQVKGPVEYVTKGEQFDDAVTWVATQNPDRVVKGLIMLTPESVFDISAGATAGKPMLS